MAMQTNAFGRAAGAAASAGPASGARLDWATSALSSWLIGGIYLDGWAHNHGKVDNTFWTPWHGVLYAGFFALALLLGAVALRNIARGHPWVRAMPAGYELSALGVAIFAFGGAADIVWHTLFGVERNIEALISPSHLLLALGGTLMITGPIRAAWLRTLAPPRWRRDGPMILALTLLLAIFAFFTQFIHPAVDAWPELSVVRGSGFFSPALGIGGILLQSALLMGVVLLALRRGPVPLGAFTLILGLSTALISVIDDQFRLVPPALLAGVAGDLLIRWLRPSVARPAALRLFAFVAPAGLYGLYMLTLAATQGIEWTIHLWSGAVVLAGVVGLLLSYLVVPPAQAPMPAE
jgi:hypothetical protein